MLTTKPLKSRAQARQVAGICAAIAVFLGACTSLHATSPDHAKAGTEPEARGVVPRPSGNGARFEGATSGSAVEHSKEGPAGPLEGKRGSTPPGSDRAGDRPSSGAIVDPTGAATTVPPAR